VVDGGAGPLTAASASIAARSASGVNGGCSSTLLLRSDDTHNCTANGAPALSSNTFSTRVERAGCHSTVPAK
jgi:hypothetical protein